MKTKNSIATVLFLLVVVVFPAKAQYVVQKASGQSVNTNAMGFYYSLPKTIYKIEVELEKITRLKGPFAEYTVKYLGTSNFIDEDKNFYRILHVDVHPITVADEKQMYWIKFPIEKSSKEIKNEAFTLSQLGTLLAFDDIKEPLAPTINTKKEVFVFSDNSTAFNKEASYNRRKEIDTIVRKITIDTVTINRFLFKISWVDRNKDEKAEDAAKQISKIRESRYNLLTGFQEVNYGQGIRYMDMQLQNLEQQYLELFLGKKNKTIISRTFIFIPSKKHLNENLMQFTTDNGRDILSVKISNVAIPEGIQDDTSSKINELYYRIPVSAKLSIKTKSKSLFQKIFIIPQLGIISTVPMGKNKIHFDFTTGSLTKIKKGIKF